MVGEWRISFSLFFLFFFWFKRTVPEERGERESSERKYDFESLKRKAGLRGGGTYRNYVWRQTEEARRRNTGA